MPADIDFQTFPKYRRDIRFAIEIGKYSNQESDMPNFSTKWVWGGKYLAERRVSVKAIIYCRVNTNNQEREGSTYKRAGEGYAND